jgi:hypothetical protein
MSSTPNTKLFRGLPEWLTIPLLLFWTFALGGLLGADYWDRVGERLLRPLVYLTAIPGAVVLGPFVLCTAIMGRLKASRASGRSRPRAR